MILIIFAKMIKSVSHWQVYKSRSTVDT